MKKTEKLHKLSDIEEYTDTHPNCFTGHSRVPSPKKSYTRLNAAMTSLTTPGARLVARPHPFDSLYITVGTTPPTRVNYHDSVDG